MQELDERSLKVLAAFAVELLAAKERAMPAPAERFSWPRWFAEASGVDLDNVAFADGRHLRKNTHENA